MVRAFQFLGFVCMLALGLSACTKNNDGRVPARMIDDPGSGSLAKDAGEVFAHKNAEACDRKNAEKILEVAKTLDAKKPEIDALGQATPLSRYYEVVKIGPTHFQKLKAPIEPRKGWHKEPDSWANVVELYESVKEKPVDKDWLKLNSRARSLLMNDRWRVLHGFKMSFLAEDIPALKRLRDTLEKCHKDTACKAPEIDEGISRIIANTAAYEKYMDDIKSKSAHDEALLKKFFEEVDLDWQDRSFYKNKTVKRVSDDTIELPLDPGIFSDSKEQLALEIESKWKSEKLRVKIRWDKRENSPDYFQIAFFPQLGQRPSMSYKERRIRLYPGSRLESVSHEVGHVLGFPDNYYTYWIGAEEHCYYFEQYDEENLMSSSQTGSVTAEQWKELESQYR